MSHHSNLTYLGYANAGRSRGRPIAQQESDRLTHCYVLGRTGTGKSHFMRLMALQDIRRGRGVVVIDPHGDLVREIAEEAALYTPVKLLSAAETDFRFNPLLVPDGTNRSFAVATILSVFQKLWEDNWGPRLEHLLRNVLHTLLANPETTFASIPRLLVKKFYRERLLRNVADLGVKHFWTNEYDKYTPGFKSVVIAPLQNKLGALLTDARLRTILTTKPDSKTTEIELGASLERGEVLLFDLSKGLLGEGPSALLGGMLSAHLVLAGLSRASVPEEQREPFFAYLDEYPAYCTSLLATGLSELRKYKLGLVLAHQYLTQLQPSLRDSALGNVGSLFSFRVGAPDAPMIAREMAPRFGVTDLISLPNYNVYTRLMISGQVSHPFSFSTYPRLSSLPNV